MHYPLDSTSGTRESLPHTISSHHGGGQRLFQQSVQVTSSTVEGEGKVENPPTDSDLMLSSMVGCAWSSFSSILI